MSTADRADELAALLKRQAVAQNELSGVLARRQPGQDLSMPDTTRAAELAAELKQLQEQIKVYNGAGAKPAEASLNEVWVWGGLALLAGLVAVIATKTSSRARR